MNEASLNKIFSSLPIGGLRYFDSIGSTNDFALSWASQGASDMSLVVSDEQTAGRGRLGRRWHTPSGLALAFSLILRPSTAELKYPTRMTGLGALALVDTLCTIRLTPQIKWPNDVLVNGCKIAGILVESDWIGNNLNAFILGMGVNVLKGSVPPTEETTFPASSIEAELGHPVDRFELLKNLLAAFMEWRNKLDRDEIIRAWESSLAFRGQQVRLTRENQLPLTGELIGLELNGNLKIRTEDGKTHEIPFGEIHLRPVI